MKNLKNTYLGRKINKIKIEVDVTSRIKMFSTMKI